MKRIWKWVIGIVVVLVVIGLLVGAGFMMRNHFGAVGVQRVMNKGWTGQSRGDVPFYGFGQHMRGPGMMGFGGMGRGMMNPFGGLIGGLVSLAFLALLVVGIVWLVRKVRTPRPVVAAVEPTPVISLASCKKCGNALQPEWHVCPNCGKKV